MHICEKIFITMMLYDLIKGHYIKPCKWKDKCKKKGCLFIHPHETVRVYLDRLCEYLHEKNFDFDRKAVI